MTQDLIHLKYRRPTSQKEVEIMDLFEYMRTNTMEKESPLAARLRPTTLE